MRALLLFARGRHWLAVSLICLGSGVLLLVGGSLNYSLNPRGGYLVTVAAQVPIFAAIAIQASLASPLNQVERAAARPIGRWLFLHLCSLTLVAIVALTIAASFLPSSAEHGVIPPGAVGLGRNLLAFTGVGLIGAAIFGPLIGWTLPLAWAILPYVALPNPSYDPSGLLMLATQPDEAFMPLLVALVIWSVGIGLAINRIGIERVDRN